MATPRRYPNQRELPPARERTMVQSWLAISSRTRLFISLGVCVVGATGLMISDYLEKAVPPPKKPADNVTSQEFS